MSKCINKFPVNRLRAIFKEIFGKCKYTFYLPMKSCSAFQHSIATITIANKKYFSVLQCPSWQVGQCGDPAAEEDAGVSDGEDGRGGRGAGPQRQRGQGQADGDGVQVLYCTVLYCTVLY